MATYQVALFDARYPLKPCQGVEYKSSKHDAIKTAQGWVTYPGRSSQIVHHSKIIAKFWRDTEGMKMELSDERVM